MSRFSLNTKASSSYSASLDSHSSTPKRSADSERFLQDYATTGPRASDGTVLNLGDTSLKVSETEGVDVGHLGSEAFGSTRPAFKITDLSKLKENTLRVKFVAYGNHNAMWEVMSGQLYGLTGLTAPDTKLLIHEDYRRENGAPQALVASPMITGYSDLGDFLVRSVVDKFLLHQPEATRISVKKWQREILAINQNAASGPITAQDKTLKLQLMRNIYLLLPDYFHNEIEKSFAASKFIANWDFANLNLNNIGCRFTLDSKTKEVIKFESAFVDFGNSGAIGFGGKYKDLSLDRANTEAKKFVAGARDYDPALTFNDKEKLFILKKAGIHIKSHLTESVSIASLDDGWMNIPEAQTTTTAEVLNAAWQALLSQNKLTETINLLSQELAENESAGGENLNEVQVRFRRRIIFKDVHHIKPHEASVVISPRTSGLLNFSDLPRNLPFGFLLEPALRSKTRSAMRLEDSLNPGNEIESPTLKKPLHLQTSFYRDSEIEMAFRLSLIPDAAIGAVVKKWNLEEDYPDVFGVQEKLDNQPEYSGEEIVRIFKDRRDALTRSIPHEVVSEWIVKNKAQALAAQQDVELAVSQRTGLKLEIERNIYFTPQAQEVSAERIQQETAAKKIIAEIDEKRLEISESQAAQDGRAHLAKLNQQLTQIFEPDQFFKDKVSEFENKLKRDQQKDLLDFIKTSLNESWNTALGLSSKPNCSLLDLNKFGKMYEIEAGKKLAGDTITNGAEDLQKDIFVLQKIRETLTIISTPSQQLPSSELSATSRNSLAGQKSSQLN